jgi:hypothetical protein
MNPAKTFLPILGFVFISVMAQGQNDGSVSQMYLAGKWTAVCPFEVINASTIRTCDLCPVLTDRKQAGSAETTAIEMTFQSDSIHVKQHGKVSVIPYTSDKNSHAVSFSLNNKKYNFRVFLYGEKCILEDADGLMMVLEK